MQNESSNSTGVLFENTLVALFDIQGYSAFVSSTPRENVISKTKKLYDFAQSISSTDFYDVKTKFWILSDTIIITIDTKRAPLYFGSAKVFVQTCSSFLYESLRFCSLPVRGAIGFGYFYFDEHRGKNDFGDSSFIVGDALVDAATYEKQQNWLGAMFTPSAVTALSGITSNEDGKNILDCSKMDKVVSKGEIPLRNGKTEKGYYLLPFKGNVQSLNWRSFLPSYFKDDNGKLANSDCLYS